MTVHYTLDSSMNVLDVGVSDVLRGHHRERHSAGQLDHALSAEEISGLRAVQVISHQ